MTKRFIFAALVLAAAIGVYLYYLDARAEYFGNSYITFSADNKRCNDKGIWSQNSYELYYNVYADEAMLTYKDNEYYYITSGFDMDLAEDNAQYVKNACKKITVFEAVLLLDHAEKHGINDAQDIPSQLIKNTPFDKNCYWENMIKGGYDSSQWTHKMKKGTRPADIDYTYNIAAVIYFLHKYIFVIAAVFCVLLCLYISRRLKKRRLSVREEGTYGV